jgi:hypothetical protein
MMNSPFGRSTLCVVAVFSCLVGRLSAANERPTLPAATELQALAVQPVEVSLKGRDDSRQLLLTATLVNGREVDLTGDAAYEIGDERVLRISSVGRLIPLGNGTTQVRARYGDRSATVTVAVESAEDDLPINFTNQIVPIFTKLGCNAGNCHGKAAGQNGFKLSLLGFEPADDYTSLVKESRGRRLFPAAPAYSLLLLKATGAMPHAGGRRLDADADEAKLLRRWIAAGMPFGRSDDPVVTRISVAPARRVLMSQGKQQLAVVAHYSNGSEVDVTYGAQYQSNDTEIAAVDASGVVSTLDQTGEAAVMVRYQGQVAAFRAVVPLRSPAPDYSFEPNTLVDRFTVKKWRELGLAPSELCSEEQFLRRVSLDVTGTLPTPDQLRSFLADRDADKRGKLVDALLESPAYSYFFANKWATVLKVRAGLPNFQYSRGTHAFHSWLVEAMSADLPYDEFVRAIVAATGHELRHPPALWYKNRTIFDQAKGIKGNTVLGGHTSLVNETAQLFLGLRLACAQCHHHPFEKWSQDDYWGMAAYFSRVGRKYIEPPGEQGVVVSREQQAVPQFIFTLSTGQVTNPRTGKPAVVKPLDGEPIEVAREDDPRQHLVDWIVSPRNPFFARAIANRYWAHFFNRGLVEPIDDLRETNPPTNPELLDALAGEFVASKHSLKHLIRLICKSRTYQLSAVPNAVNQHDKQTYARYYPRRMQAEVLYDAVVQVTNGPHAFERLPQDTHAPRRAIMLPDESHASYFLDVFGRPERLTACECERSADVSLAQVLHLLNSKQVLNLVLRAGGRADRLARDVRPDADKLDELFLWFYGRKPTEAHREMALKHLEEHAQNKKLAYENIVWALLNTKEFLFNH